MLSSSVRSFKDYDEYGRAVRAAQVELTLTERGDFAAHLSRVDLQRLWMQRLSDNLPRILRATCVPGRTIMTFVEWPGPEVVVNGVTLPECAIVRHSDGDDFNQRSSGATLTASMSLPNEDVSFTGTAMAGCDLTPPHDTLVVTPGPAAMTRLRRLHAAVGHLAEEASEVLVNPAAAFGLEQELVQAMVACLSPAAGPEDKSARRRHRQIIQRFLAFLEADPGSAVYLSDLCRALCVPERTLRTCCLEYFGMGPVRYLNLRRLHLARRELGLADPGTATVTDTAMRYGFWELGRFAAEYRHVFGELPSSTLRRSPEAVDNHRAE